MKYVFVYIIFCCLFLSCTKDVSIDIPPEPSQRYKALTQNYWRLDHEWNDTSQIAKDNPSLLPLSTSYDTKLSNDSCEYYTGEKI